jgi:parvulin-like peptidyl-prolyl isomerase
MEIRRTLHEERRVKEEDRLLRARYAARRESLSAGGIQVRYAVADTASFPVPDPPAAELDRYYRGHLADYSYFDAKTSSVGSRPFAEVRGDVRRRMLQERRATAARAAAEALLAAWKSGKRDAKLERAMSWMREVGPVPVDGVVDTGAVGDALGDTLRGRWGAGAGWFKHRRGFAVYHVFGEVKDYTPTIDEARPTIDARRADQQEARDEAGARRLFEKDPTRFQTDNVIHFARVMVNLPDVLAVPLSREEVEQWYRAHPDDYGAPELAHVRHILITPKDASPKADADARARAEEVLRKLRGGESFEALVKAYSDDAATRGKGGDVGVFRHGMMLDEFEREAFAMRPGDVRGPVRTEVGYHVLECLEHVPAEVTPLRYAYSTVAADAAREKADRIARVRADSLRRAVKTPAQAVRAATTMQFSIFRNDHIPGKSPHVEALEDYFRRIERLKPREFDERVQEYKGMGYAISWVDSTSPQLRPNWETVRDQAIDLYRRERDRAEMQRKRADLDSLRRAGWSFDSLTTLYGGAERHGPRGPGSGLERLAGRQLLDSLAFGTAKTPPVLQLGKPTDWIEFPGGLVMMKLVERRHADPVQLASRLENEQRGRLELKLRKVYDRLKERYPVVIQDQELRLTELPGPPGS